MPYIDKIIKLPILAEVVVHSITGVLRIYLNGNQNVKGDISSGYVPSWYAFLGEPLINFDVNLTVGEDTKIEISLPTVCVIY